MRRQLDHDSIPTAPAPPVDSPWKLCVALGCRALLPRQGTETRCPAHRQEVTPPFTAPKPPASIPARAEKPRPTRRQGPDDDLDDDPGDGPDLEAVEPLEPDLPQPAAPPAPSEPESPEKESSPVAEETTESRKTCDQCGKVMYRNAKSLTCWNCRHGKSTTLVKAKPPRARGAPTMGELPRVEGLPEEYLLECARELMARKARLEEGIALLIPPKP